MSAIRSVILVAAIALTGCGGGSKPKGEALNVPTLPPAPTGPAVEHPDYAAWKRFKPGTTVTRTAIVARKGTQNKVIVTETFKLVALSDTEVKVERQKTVERIGEDAGVTTSSPETRTAPTTFPLPDGLTADTFRLPDAKAKLNGEETVPVLGKEYKCRVYSFTNPTDGAGPMAVTVWWSDDMPGRIVKQTATTGGSTGTDSTETVTKVTVP